MNDTVSESGTSQTCLNCGSPAILKEFPNPLCESCRESYIKFPIPLWIKIFAGGICIVLLFSLYKIPQNISVGVHLDKAETAFAEKKYMTAQKEFLNVLRKIPGNLEMKGDLVISAFYNEDYNTYDSVLNKISNQQVDDQDLYSRVNAVIEAGNTVVPQQNFAAVFERNKKDFSAIPDTAFDNYLAANPGDLFVATLYASRLSDNKKYPLADSLLKGVLAQNNEYIPGLEMMSSVKRMQLDYEGSLSYCKKVLEVNSESVSGLASLSRTYLRMKNDKEALRLALESVSLDGTNAEAIMSLALAYHFTHHEKERDALFAKLSSFTDTTSVQALRYVKDVISGKEQFRN